MNTQRGNAYVQLTPGDPAPWFQQATDEHPNFKFHAMAGNYVVLALLATGRDAVGQAVLSELRQAGLTKARVFAVSNDPGDQAGAPDAHFRFVWDFDGHVARQYGSLPADPKAGNTARRFWMVLDPMLRVMALFPIVDGAGRIPQALRDYVKNLPPPELAAGVEVQAPVLYLPRVFEEAFCQDLIAYHQRQNATPTGVMRQRGGETVEVADLSIKSRTDCIVEDPALVGHLQMAIGRRVLPEVRKAFQFDVGYMERYLVGCYSADSGGHFAPHRDNTSDGTAHRRFAITVNLNDDYEGGALTFPEYGPRLYRPSIGSAVVFSCSLMHAVMPVTTGRRYAFLPFLHDDAAEQIRRSNAAALG